MARVWRRWSVNPAMRHQIIPRRLRPMLLEPLEERKVLTTGLTFASTAFSEDPTTHNLTVHYNLAADTTSAFSIALDATGERQFAGGARVAVDHRFVDVDRRRSCLHVSPTHSPQIRRKTII